MLVSLITAAAEVSGRWQPFSPAEVTDAVGSHLRPEDPTTLTLALIGAATMAVYFAVRRGERDRGTALVEPVGASTPLAEVVASSDIAATTAVEQPSRGAA
jgi:hypothetical protein